MTTDTWTQGGGNEHWQDPNNWSGDAVPAPGDTVQIPGGFDAQVEFGDLSLYNMTVNITDGVNLVGNILVLAKTDFSTAGSIGSGIDANDVFVGKMSFITGDFGISSGTINNDGTMGQENPGAGEGMTITDVGVTNFVNTGQLVASNGGEVTLDRTNVTGSTGAINVSNGGVLQLNDSTIASSQKVNLGGETATTLAFDPGSSSISATISGFDVTDFIHLEDFVGSVTSSGPSKPTLTFTGFDNTTNAPTTFALTLAGSYKHEAFSLVGDAAGTGQILLVNHV